jgi:hypothetical protein
VFNSFAKSVQKCSRQLTEVIATHMLLTGVAKRQREDWQELILSTSSLFSPRFPPPPISYPVHSLAPRLEELSATSLIYSNSILENPPPPPTPDSANSDPSTAATINESNADSELAKQAKEEALKYIEEEFVTVKNPRAELDKGFRFWDAVRLRPSHLLLFLLAMDATDR